MRAEQDERRRMRVAAVRVGRGNFFEAGPRRMSRVVGMAATHVRASVHRLMSRRQLSTLLKMHVDGGDVSADGTSVTGTGIVGLGSEGPVAATGSTST